MAVRDGTSKPPREFCHQILSEAAVGIGQPGMLHGGSPHSICNPNADMLGAHDDASAIEANVGSEDDLRQRVEAHLRSQGFAMNPSTPHFNNITDKPGLRALHADAVDAGRLRAAPSLARHEQRLVTRLAHGRDLDPERIRPRLVALTDNPRSIDVLTWRWCALHWSIPVSSGYGRRLRFLVIDEGNNNAVIGIVGLGDPVFALSCRDNAIGWDREQRCQRLACVLDAFVLGAVPPYTYLCGGKLVALLATSAEVREAFNNKYAHRTTLISKRDPHAELALVTTTSALGRSSVYNRIRRADGQLAYRPVGYTGGTGDFHFSGSIYRELATFATALVMRTQRDQQGSAESRLYHRHPDWPGQTFRNRREVIQRALDGLGLPSRQLRMHGVRRQVFLAPLAENALAWLRSGEEDLRWWTYRTDAIGDWWRTRWAIPRARGSVSWRDFDPSSWHLYDREEEDIRNADQSEWWTNEY